MLVSGVGRLGLLCVVVLAAPSLLKLRARGEGAFLTILNGVLPRPLVIFLGGGDCRSAVSLRAGHRDLGVTNGICLCARRRPSLFARGPVGLPEAALAGRRDLGRRGRLVLFTIYTPVYATITAVCTIFLYVSYVVRALGAWAYGESWTHGSMGLGPLVSAAGCYERVGCTGLILMWNAAAESKGGMGGGRLRWPL